MCVYVCVFGEGVAYSHAFLFASVNSVMVVVVLLGDQLVR